MSELAALVEGARTRLVVTAHPDDESLWCGGLIATFPGDWMVLCCSIPKRDPQRAGLLGAACQELGVRMAFCLPFTEAPAREPLPYLPGVLLAAGFDGVDLVVTHGPAGEYGHVQHRQVSDLVCDRAGGRVPVLGIGYRPGGATGHHQLPLSHEAWSRKLAAIRAYSHELTYKGKPTPKGEELLDKYGGQGFDLTVESYDRLC